MYLANLSWLVAEGTRALRVLFALLKPAPCAGQVVGTVKEVRPVVPRAGSWHRRVQRSILSFWEGGNVTLSPIRRPILDLRMERELWISSRAKASPVKVHWGTLRHQAW